MEVVRGGVLPAGTSGAVMSLHTAGDLLNFHPHVHSLVLPGVVTQSGEYQELPEIDTELLGLLLPTSLLFLEINLSTCHCEAPEGLDLHHNRSSRPLRGLRMTGWETISLCVW